MTETAEAAPKGGSGFGPVGGWGPAGAANAGGFGFGPMAPMPPMRMPFRGRGGWRGRGRGWRGRGWRGRGRGRGGAGTVMNVDVTAVGSNMGDVEPLDEETRTKLNDICTTLIEIRDKSSATDKQRVNSALAHLRKIGTPSARIIDYQAPPQYKRGVQLDRPGTEKMKEALLIMKALVKDLPDEHEKHRVVAEHVVSNLTKLVKQNCTYSGTEEMKYDGEDDGLSRAKAAKELLQDMDADELLSEKELRNFNATINTVQAFVSRVTDRNYRPAKVKWLLENSATYENPDWKPTGKGGRRSSPPVKRERSRERSRDRSRRRRRRRSRSRDRR